MNPDSRLFQALSLLLFLVTLGCGPASEAPSRQTLTYTFDATTRDLIAQLAKKEKIPAYIDFDRYFKGLLVPESLLPLEPFVLGLATESKVPTVLLLDAPWVQRYGAAGWLFELESTRIFSKEELVPAVAEAFSVSLAKSRGGADKELVAVPTYIKGNILFYRLDLLKRYQIDPPHTWEELQAICQRILPRERSLKYGLLFHAANFVNDFYPIFWGYGGKVIDAEGQLVLDQPKNLKAFVASLQGVRDMLGKISPSPSELKNFEPPRSLRQAFFRGEALFMINWNTRMQDLKGMIRQGTGTTPGRLTSLEQIGVAPIPCRSGHPHRYTNIGSFGWGVNRFAVTDPMVIDKAKEFIRLVAEEEFQLAAAETSGQIPALRRALEKVTNPEVLYVYQKTFASPDMVLRPRPFGRRIKNVLEKYLQAALKGERSPEDAAQAAIRDLKGREMAATR